VKFVRVFIAGQFKAMAYFRESGGVLFDVAY